MSALSLLLAAVLVPATVSAPVVILPFRSMLFAAVGASCRQGQALCPSSVPWPAVDLALGGGQEDPAEWDGGRYARYCMGFLESCVTSHVAWEAALFLDHQS